MKSELCRISNEVELALISSYLRGQRQNPDTYSCSVPHYLKLREEATFGSCGPAVNRASVELYKAGRDTLDAMAAVTAVDDINNPFRLDWDLGRHAGLIAHERDAGWFYFSPANFTGAELSSETIVAAGTTAELFDGIRRREGGRWADPARVEAMYLSGLLRLQDPVNQVLKFPKFDPDPQGAPEKAVGIWSVNMNNFEYAG